MWEREAPRQNRGAGGRAETGPGASRVGTGSRSCGPALATCTQAGQLNEDKGLEGPWGHRDTKVSQKGGDTAAIGR